MNANARPTIAAVCGVFTQGRSRCPVLLTHLPHLFTLQVVTKLLDETLGTGRFDVPRRSLRLVRNLGSGNFGTVDLYVAERVPGLPPSVEVAVKVRLCVFDPCLY